LFLITIKKKINISDNEVHFKSMILFLKKYIKNVKIIKKVKDKLNESVLW